MAEKVMDEFIVPACSGEAFRVNKGQMLRVIEHEAKQTAAIIFLNAHNYKEQCMGRFSGDLSQALGIGNHYRPGKIFSKVPYENVMVTVVKDTVGRHFAGPHCTREMMRIWNAPGHRSCSDNFADALSEYGLTLEDIYSPAAFHAFANVVIDPKGDGKIRIEPPTAEVGDYIEFLAEMDILAVVSACPDDISPMNDHSCKPIKIQIVE